MFCRHEFIYCEVNRGHYDFEEWYYCPKCNKAVDITERFIPLDIKVYAVGHTDQLRVEVYLEGKLSYVLRTTGYGVNHIRQLLNYDGIIYVKHDIMFFIPSRERYKYKEIE